MLRLFSALVFLVTFLLAAFSQNSFSAGVQEFNLDNGLKVLLLEDHKSPAVTFQVWYRVGSRNEQDGKSGLAHFLEHMMFKGTPTTGPEAVFSNHRQKRRPSKCFYNRRCDSLLCHHEPRQNPYSARA